jgi:hypothetical protein
LRRTRQRWTSWCFCLCGHFVIDEAAIGRENCKKGELLVALSVAFFAPLRLRPFSLPYKNMRTRGLYQT